MRRCRRRRRAGRERVRDHPRRGGPVGGGALARRGAAACPRAFLFLDVHIEFSKTRILVNHILPMTLAPLIVISAANFASAILMESGLSFLGIGAQPPMPSWGGMVKDHFRYLLLGKPYLAILPGLAIMSLVLAFMILGNSLRDALDVRR